MKIYESGIRTSEYYVIGRYLLRNFQRCIPIPNSLCPVAVQQCILAKLTIPCFIKKKSLPYLLAVAYLFLKKKELYNQKGPKNPPVSLKKMVYLQMIKFGQSCVMQVLKASWATTSRIVIYTAEFDYIQMNVVLNMVLVVVVICVIV